MSEHVRSGLVTLFLVMFGAAMFVAGRHGDQPVRDPLSIATLGVMLGSFLAVLFLSAPIGRDR